MSVTVDDEVAEHYARLGGLYGTLGELHGNLTPANADFTRWYNTKAGAAPPAGFDGQARAWALAPDYDDLRECVERVMYATVNYASRDYYARSWAPYRWNDGVREWDNDANPLPGYGDIEAYAPFADIDLADDVKEHRPDGDVPTSTIERALAEYVAAFADLAGTHDAVHVLDSVGGAYVMLAPSITEPIAVTFTSADRARIFDELTDRLNEWLEGVASDVLDTVPDVEGVFEPDLVNHKNRLYKAPMSVHSSLDGVVTPVDTHEPTYEYTPLAEVGRAEIDAAEAWAESFTADYSEHVGDLVAMLWTDEYTENGSWSAALRAWLDADAANADPVEKDTLDDVADDAGAEIAPFDVVRQRLDALDAERVAEKTIVARWNEGAHTKGNARAFYPTWGPDSNGTATIVVPEKSIFVDTGDKNAKGGVVEMALIAAGGWTRGEIARGADWVRGIEELRNLGFDVPLPMGDPDADRSAYYALPLTAVAREQLGDASELYNDPAKLLKACLLARDEYGADLEDATPPYKVLAEIAERVGLNFKNAEENILGRDSHRLACTIYDDMTASGV